MSIKNKIRSAITAVFPAIESIAGFIEDSENRQRLNSFVNLAARHDLITRPDSDAFKAFITANRHPLIGDAADRLTMGELIDNKREYLNIKMSNRALTDKINLLISNNNIDLPPLSTAMLTRLKQQPVDTPRKRDALRSFAFWIGYERRDLGREWHFEILKDLCFNGMQKWVNTALGVRIAFSINGRGSVIGQEIMLWLKRTIKKILDGRTNTSFNGVPAKVRNYDLSTFYVDLPNREAGEIPAAFGNTLKEAVAIAYHLTIQWMTSGFANYNRFCFIGIAAGDFSELNLSLEAALNAKLPDDPAIRLTDYTRQCVMINEIRVILNHIPEEVESAKRESAKVWWVRELSSILYWELTPGMLNGAYQDDDKNQYLKLKRQLRFQGASSMPRGRGAPISYFVNFPYHSMLGFEIARTLFCRKKLMETLEILNILLKINPGHISSRVMRMMIYKIFAVEALNYRLADMMFRRAEREARYIMEKFKHTDEDFYYEYAVLKLARLAAGIKALRKNPDGRVDKGLRVAAADLLALADTAEEILIEGISLSLSAERIYYLFYSVHILKIVLAESLNDDGTFLPRLACPKSKIKHYLLEVLISSATYQKFPADMPDINTFNQIITDMVSHFNSSVALEIFKPTLHFSNAIIFWDLMPARTVAFVLSTLKELKNGIKAARVHALRKEPIFSYVTMAGQIIPAEKFISQLKTLIEEIEKRYGKTSDLEKMDPAQEIGADDDDLVLMTYHV